MLSDYPLPSKASLVQQFVGKTLNEIPLPAAVIDIAAVKRNCQRMSDAVKDLGFDFVPVVNVHKVRMKLFYYIKLAHVLMRIQTTEISQIQIGDDPEQARVLVSNLSKAENLLPLFLEYQKEGK